MTVSAVLFQTPGSMAVAGVFLVATVAVSGVRRLWPGRAASALIVAGGGGWALAAGTPVWDRPAVRRVAVLVDLSPSTRGADYRDRATLDRRVAQLLGATPYDAFAFAGGAPRPLPGGPTLTDLPCDRTVFAPPSADAVLLFSDGRFTLPPVASPTFAVIDPSLEAPVDAAVQRLRWADGRVTATVAAPGPQTLRWTGAEPATSDATGGGVMSAHPTAAEVTAAVDGHDRWPENDRLTIHAPPPAVAERWWVGTSAAPAGFRPVTLPVDRADYLAAAVIVLDDVAADTLTSEQQRQLLEYVRDDGGGVVIGGGPSAFAAGGYGSTPLEAISPLASDPPTPAERWVVLVDGSGSMGTPAGSAPTPWEVERDAVARLLPALPPLDPVRVGSFAADVTWWGDATAAGQARADPPAGLAPVGVTNLLAAVRRVIAGADAGTLLHLLLMTDADADLPDPAALSAALVAAHVRLHVLATGNGSALPALRAVVARTDGSVVQAVDPAGWVAAAHRLARSAVPRRFVGQPTTVHWVGASGSPSAPAWNRTWLKPRAEVLATGPEVPLAADWAVGSGRTLGVAFAADAATLARLADRVAAAPRDPRFAVSCETGARLRVSVDAVDQGQYLNGLAVSVQSDAGAVPLPQTGPGEYAADLAAPERPTLGTVRVEGRTVERLPLPGRYAAEFDAVGTDRAALSALCRQTGGALVEPATTGPLTFPGPPRRTPLAPPLATAGAALAAAGLIRCRRGGA